MKKVLIVTMHRGDNYGSALQVYALSECLKNIGRGGYCPVVLDYIPERVSLAKRLRDALKRIFLSRSASDLKVSVRGVLIILSNWRCFNKFFNRELSMTRRYGSYEDVVKDGICADVYMTGSDQVWNSFHNRGIEPVFFLKFAPDGTRKISYSASFGKSCLEDWEKEETRKLLSRYDAISVRELSARQIVEGLGLSCEVVLDPTFLLDLSEWEKRSIAHREKDRYVLIYSVEPDKQSAIEVARRIADRMGVKVFMVEWGRRPYPGVDKMISLVDPLMLIDYFLKAEFIVASSFHGTALSINLCRPFVSLTPARFATRVKSILEIAGLPERMCAPDEFDLDEALEAIDYEAVAGRLAKERKKSVNFLELNLKTDGAGV